MVVAMEEKLKMSLLYSVAVAVLIVLALAISSQFMSIKEGEPFDVIASVLLNTVVILFIFFLCILASVALGFSFLFFRLDQIQASLIDRLQALATAAAARPAAAPARAPAEGAPDPNLPAVMDFIRSNPAIEVSVLAKQLEDAGFPPGTIREGISRARPEKK